MKRLAALALMAAMAAPAFGGWPVQVVPLGTGATAPMRPEVNNGWIAAVNREGTGNTGGILYDVNTLTLYGNVAPVQLQNAGYWHEPQADISDNYAAFGGAASSQSLTFGINVLNRNTNTVINIPGTDIDEHLVSLNNAGDVVWIKWAGTTPEAIMYSDVSSGTATVPIELVSNLTTAGQGERMRMSTDARRLAYRPLGNGSQMWVYDLATNTNAQVLALDGVTQKAFFSGIDDTGNWLTTNVRGAAGQWSDIYLVDISNLGAPVSYPLFGNTSAIREDPRFEVLDANTGIVVWDEDPTGANNQFKIRAAFVTGLAGTPVLGTPFDLTTFVAGVSNSRWPDVDTDGNGNILIAWQNVLNQGASSGGQIEYAVIPEPASLALLALGGLALIRRR
ncbi:MAG: PEP-CTERM sorting domain-containing protein [Phycisphaerales bacterium]|nr:PEP-CTERM sorting domain-containing protein [Phycisphaerales bacterium]